MIGVLGAGFGLYGHLPAWVELGREVLLPERYRAAVEARDELKAFKPAVSFIDDEQALIDRSTIVVLARRPGDNQALARAIVGRGRAPTLVIEKPPAPTPYEALNLVATLKAAAVSYAVPYLLVYCDWASALRARLDQDHQRIAVNWSFHSPTVTAQSWKAAPPLGGGPLAYYLIHMFALTAHLLGEDAVLKHAAWSPSEGGDDIALSFEGGRGDLTVRFASGAVQSRFQVVLSDETVFVAETPFGPAPARGQRDPRINILKRFYGDAVLSGTRPWSRLDEPAISLWATAERYIACEI